MIVWLLAREGLNRGASLLETVLACLAAVALICSMSDTQSLLIPFQAVLTVSRLFYLSLLLALCFALIQRRPALYASAMLLAVPAVTFHGTGQIFGLSIIILHVLLRQGALRTLGSCVPLVFGLFIQSRYSVGVGELSSLGAVLTPSALPEVALAVAAYFATPFVAFLHIVDNRLLLIPGAILACSTLLLTLLGLRAVLGLNSWSPRGWLRQLRTPGQLVTAVDPAVAFFTIAGLLLLISSLVAAVLGFVRTAPLHLRAWPDVFDATRYAAYSTLACIMPLAAWLHRPAGRHQRSVSRLLPLSISVLLLAAGLGGTLRMAELSPTDDGTNAAVAAMMVGISPTIPENLNTWPSVRGDWYWTAELPRVAAWLRAEGAGPFRYLPPLHTRGGPSYAAYQLNDMKMEPFSLQDAPGWCRVTATIPAWGRGLPSRSTIAPLAGPDGIVVGYAVLTRKSSGLASRTLTGTVGCGSVSNLLFIPPVEAPRR
ncbi:hypothetical protein [Roseomonas sp. KE2513]|uniref:hypothetical protein n=1 Tax=Roseomonas sp. KE2513 TaxID=2479202 RepID=UPI0018DF4198|nr:hypothetical protein [Roseomonas sp. KE2513]